MLSPSFMESELVVAVTNNGDSLQDTQQVTSQHLSYIF